MRGPQQSSDPHSEQPSSIDIRPPQAGHSATPSATRSSQAPSTTSSSVTPPGSNSLPAERSARDSAERLAREVPVATAATTHTFLSTPTTLPSSFTSGERIGLCALLSGWSRIVLRSR